MKLVGEAVAEELPKYNTKLIVLGIATWGMVKHKEALTETSLNVKLFNQIWKFSISSYNIKNKLKYYFRKKFLILLKSSLRIPTKRP